MTWMSRYAVLTMAVTLALPVAGQISNPSFESGQITPWQSSAQNFRAWHNSELGDVANAPDGDYFAGVTVTDNGVIHEFVPTTPGRRYAFSLYAYTDGSDGAGPSPTVKYRYAFAPFRHHDAWLTQGNQHGHPRFYYSHPLFSRHHVWDAETWGMSPRTWSFDRMYVRAETLEGTVMVQWGQLASLNNYRNLFDNIRLDELAIPLGAITGTVRDQLGAPVSGAVVGTNPWSYTGTTDPGGVYTIDGVPEGMFDLTALKTGFPPSTATGLRIYADRTATLDFELELAYGQVGNPGFEEVEPLDQQRAVGWTPYGNALHVERDGQWFFELPAHDGERFVGSASNWSAKQGGLYQQVAVQPGHTYRASVYALTYAALPDTNPTCRIGLHTGGGTNPATVTHWSPDTESQLTWTEISVEGTATTDLVTVFLDYQHLDIRDWKINAFDSVSMVDVATGQQVAMIAAAAQAQDGETLLLNGGFETADTYNWTRAYQKDKANGWDYWVQNEPLTVTRTAYEIVPAQGSFMFGGTSSWDWGGARELLYQAIPATPGDWYRVSATFYTHHQGTPSGVPPYGRLLASPQGDTSFPVYTEQLRGAWETFTLDFQATTEWPLVGVELVQGGFMEWAHYYVDDISVVRLEGAPDTTSAVASVPTAAGVVSAQPRVLSYVPGATAIIEFPGTNETLEMVYVPAGDFERGSNITEESREDEYPRHTVHTDGFWISKTAISNYQYQIYRMHNPQVPEPPDPNFLRGYGEEYGFPYFPANPNHPVLNVSWHDAAAFCEWLGMRLPTEAEWEKAAGWDGTKTLIHPYGDHFNDIAQNSRDNHPGDDYLYTCPVRRTFHTPNGPNHRGPQSPWGCFNMTGNTWEWCADWYAPYSGDYETNPAGPETGTHKVLKGGSYRSLEYKSTNRVATRRSWPPEFYLFGEVGFRIAVSELPTAPEEAAATLQLR